jgi:hypothetical protein
MTNRMISISPSSTFLFYIAISPAYGVYISQLIRYTRACSTYDEFLIEAVCWQNVDATKISAVSFTSSFPNILWSLRRSSLPIQPSFRPNAVLCVSYQSLSRIWYTDLDYGSNRLPELELLLTAGVTGRQGMLTPPKHLTPPLVCPQRSVLALLPDLYFLQVLWDWLLFVIYAIYFTHKFTEFEN